MTTKCFNPHIVMLGCGQIGGALALLAGLKQMSSNVTMVDVVEGVPEGKSLDVGQGLACSDIGCRFTCSTLASSAEVLKGADVVIVTAGFPRKPGMTRDDLVLRNAEVISGVAKMLKASCPDAFVVCITNPLDVMVGLLQAESGIPANRVVGMAGGLDSARCKSFLAEALNVCPADVRTLVLGGHGDEMVPLVDYTSVAGVPLRSLIQMGEISQQQVDDIFARTRTAGAEVLSHLKTSSAFVAPAIAALEIVQSYLLDLRRIIPCCAYLENAYGFDKVYGGVPAIIGRNGVERVLQLPLSPPDLAAFSASLKSVEPARAICRENGYKC